MALMIPGAESNDVVNCHHSILLEGRKLLRLKYLMGFTYDNSKTLLCTNVSNTQSAKLLKVNSTQKIIYSGVAR